MELLEHKLLVGELMSIYPKFDVVVGNPPFQRNLHLKIIQSILPHIKETGCFIHPSRWFVDPTSTYKRTPDKSKFKDLTDRIEEVKLIDNKTSNDLFGITVNGELMISKVRPEPIEKEIKVYNEIAQKCIDHIISYSRKHNLGQHIDKNKVDGWRVQVKELTGIVPNVHSMTNHSRKNGCNLFTLNKVNVFHNGFSSGVEWMKTRRQTTGKKSSGSPFPHSIKFKNRKESENFEKSCNTNFYNNMIYLLKTDMHTQFDFLPWMVDYSHPWTDKDYCDFFGKLGMSKECQKWMCRDVYDYRFKDFVQYEKIVG